MGWLSRLFRRRALEQQLDDELRFHLEEHVRELRAQGLGPAEAERRARLALGGIEQVKERARDARGTRWVEETVQDLRFAVRSLRRDPGFALAAILTLAVGIGANVAVFSLIEAVLLRTLPVDAPEELEILTRTGLDAPNHRFSYPLYEELREAVSDAAELTAWSPMGRMYLRIGELQESGLAQLVDGNWFSLLGVGTRVGRPIGPTDARPGAPAVAVLSDSYWARRFGSDPALIGETLEVNGIPVTVIGVAEQDFRGVVVGESPDFWLPLTLQHELRHHGNMSNVGGDSEAPWMPQPEISWLRVTARIAPDIRPVVAERLAAVHHARIEDQLTASEASQEERDYRLREELTLQAMARGLSPLRDDMGGALLALMASVAVVLAIACCNLASLLLARGAARRQEIAVRAALGARGGRLVRLMLAECLTLACAGGALGLFVAQWAATGFLRSASTRPTGIPVTLSLYGPVLGFAIGASLLTGLVFGLIPAWRLAQARLQDTFRPGDRVRGAAGTLQSRWGRVLVIGQIAFSLVLLVAAGLFARTLGNLVTRDTGYDRGRLVVARIDARAAGYQPEQLAPLYEGLLESLRAVPEVRSVSLSLTGVATGSMRTSGYRVIGVDRGPDWDDASQDNSVTPEFFATVGIPLLRGRALEPTDGPGAPRVVVVNEAMARHFFESEEPLGATISYGGDSAFEIVGVVADARVNSLREEVPRMVYHALAQDPRGYADSIELRIEGDPASAIPGVRAALARVAPDLPLREIVAVEDLLLRGLQRERFVAQMAGVFALLAAALATIGLYGGVSYAVGQRTGEIGLRLAVGSTPSGVRRLVIVDTLRVLAPGLALGLLLMLPTTALLRSLIFGVSPRDPITITLAVLALLSVGTVAAAVPAWRASRVDPVRALRAD